MQHKECEDTGMVVAGMVVTGISPAHTIESSIHESERVALWMMTTEGRWGAEGGFHHLTEAVPTHLTEAVPAQLLRI
jgi:hypothetical protein